jgi:hypothetical protein
MLHFKNSFSEQNEVPSIWSKLFISVLVSSAMTGCLSSTPTQPQEAPIVINEAANSPAQFVSEVAQRLEKSKKDDVAKFSLVNYPSAVEEFDTLKEMNAEYNPKHSGFFSTGYSYENISEQRDMIMSKLDKAYLVQENIKNNMQDVLDNISYLTTLDLSVFKDRHENLIEDAHSLFKDVELAEAFAGFESDKQEVLNDMRLLEQDVMKARFLQPLQQRLALLKEGKIPLSYQHANETLQTFEAKILADPRLIDMMVEEESKGNKAVTRAKTIQTEVEWVKENQSKSIENVVLKYRTPVDQALPQVLDKDVSELPFEQQLPIYVEQINSIQQRLQANMSTTEKGEIDRLAEEATAIQLEKLKLELKQEFEAEYESKLALADQENKTLADEKVKLAMSELDMANKDQGQKSEQAQIAQTQLKQQLDEAQASILVLNNDKSSLVQEITALKASVKKAEANTILAEKEVEAIDVVEPEAVESEPEVVVDFDFDIVSPQ